MGNLSSKITKKTKRPERPERPESIWGYNPVSPTPTNNDIGGLFLSSIPNGKKFTSRLFLEVGNERKTVWFQETSFKIDGFSIFFRDDRVTIVFTINERKAKIDNIILELGEFEIVSNKLVSWKKKKFLTKPVTTLSQDESKAYDPWVDDFASFMHNGTSTIQANRGNVQGGGVWLPISFPNSRFILYDETPTESAVIENATVSHDGASSGNVVDPDVDLSGRVVPQNVASSGDNVHPEVAPSGRVIPQNVAPSSDVVHHDGASSGGDVHPEVAPSGNVVDPDVASLQEFDVEKVIRFNGKKHCFTLERDNKSITYTTHSGQVVNVNLGVSGEVIDFIIIKPLFKKQVVLIFIYGKDGSLHLSSHTVQRTTTNFTSMCISSSQTRDPSESIKCEWLEEETNSLVMFKLVILGKTRTFQINLKGEISRIPNLNSNI